MTVTDVQGVEIAQNVKPLDQAKRLDKRIRETSGNIQKNWDALLDMIGDAKGGQVHLTLGFKSWTEYLASAVQITPRSVDERRELVSLLSGEGMSQGAISDVTGASQATVSRDVEKQRGQKKSDDFNEGDAQAEPETTTGVDGKTYSRERKPREKKETPPSQQPKQVPLEQEFREALGNLNADSSSILTVVSNDRFPDAAKKVREKYRGEMNGIIQELSGVVDIIDSHGK